MHQGLPAIARSDARVVILGTLPGPLSLEKSQYYAKQNNAFWKIMGELVGASSDVPDERAELLRQNGIALWDVYAAAAREGSDDSNIEATGAQVNDFTAFLAAHPKIRLICFNGQPAAAAFEKLVVPRLPPIFREIPRRTLPSTSAAYAAMPFSEKLRIWRAALEQAGVLPLPFG